MANEYVVFSDLEDGGAAHFAETVREIKKRYCMHTGD